MTSHGDERNRRLRSVLRDGDPAAGDPRLTQEELRTMRRAVLNAAPPSRRPRRRGWLVPLLASSAAGGVLAAVLVLSLWRSGPVVPAPAAETISQPGAATSQRRETASQPGAATSQRWETASQPGTATSQRRETTSQPSAAASQPGETASIPGDAARDEVAAADAGPHQIQFSTPGGTRVIWLLNPAGE